MPTWSRRRVETMLLAMLGIVSVIPLRFYVESRFWFLAEFGSLCIAFLVAEAVKVFDDRWSLSNSIAKLATGTLAIIPTALAIAARSWGSPIAFEMSALATFGAVSLSLAIGATTNRIRSLSVITSGFLVLFCASISDDRYATVLPLIWMLGCVWHLVANHWDRLDLATPESVQRTWSLRPSTMVVTLLVLVAGGFAVKDRMISPSRLALGLMPTSGGSEWSDPAARSGVGTGDAAIAAKDHAESFGAVDSDFFLESTESTLFDMFNDMIGDPKIKKNKWERRQAIGNENMIPMHERAAKSEQGGGTFSTERMPPKKHRHFKDASEASVVQWDGPTGIRLAMQRYDTFDGHQWSQSTDASIETLQRVDINEAPWFFDPAMRDALSRDPAATSVGLLKVIRLNSQRLPVPMMTAGVHIKKVDRRDFFGVAEDGSFFMPGRDKVPLLTVVHVASLNLTEDEIQDHLAANTETTTTRFDQEVLETSTADLLDSLVQTATAGQTRSLDRLKSCVETLRTEFTFARAGEDSAASLRRFLQSRRGGDHLFATTAALMARQIGLRSRLVTGFYVRPEAFDVTAGHASVRSQDVHVWAEVQLDDGRWFEIEPTPGYRQPDYRPSWRSVAQRFASAYWPIMVAAILSLAGLYFLRNHWIDGLLNVVWILARWLRPHHQARLAIRIIEIRARIAGQRRPVGQSQRAWLEQLTQADATLASAAKSFLDAADALFFGQRDETSDRVPTGLVDLLPTQTIIALTKEAKL